MGAKLDFHHYSFWNRLSKKNICLASAYGNGFSDFGVEDFDFSKMENQLAEIESELKKDQTEKRSSLRNSRSAPILEPLQLPKRPQMNSMTSNQDNGGVLYFKNASGEQERIPTLAERYENNRFSIRQEMIRTDNLEYIGMQRIPSETTVILTHRTDRTDQSGGNTIKSGTSKLEEFQDSWGVSEETAKLMLKRQKMMKGSRKKQTGSKSHHTGSRSNHTGSRAGKAFSSKSHTGPLSPRSKKDKTWIPSNRSEADIPNSRIQNWLSNVDAGRQPTPEGRTTFQTSTNHFQKASKQLNEPKIPIHQNSPLPPIRKSRAWI